MTRIEMGWNQYDGGAGTAKTLLLHYIQLCMERGGNLNADCDTGAEIEQIVDAIINAAVARVAGIVEASTSKGAGE